MNNYQLIKRYHIVYKEFTDGSVTLIEDNIPDKKTALNHIIYKIKDDIFHPPEISAKGWMVEEYYIVNVN